MKHFFYLSLVLGVLSLSPVASSQPSSQHNHSMEKGASHDPHFLDMMSQHHKEGIKMAEMAATKAESKDIKAMAEKIAKDQKEELKQMQEWRQKKFSSAPKSEQKPSKMDLSKLENAKGAEFDKTFAMMMAKHHEDGIKMAQEAIPMLKDNQVKQFAQNATKNQTREMKKLHSLHSSLEKKSSTGTGTGTTED